MALKGPPKGKLYKYFALNSAERESWLERLLTKDEIFLPLARKFNDPFDCKVPSLTSQPTAVLAKLAEDFLKRRNPPVARPTRRRIAAEWANNPNAAVELHTYLQKNVDRCGVLSLSERCDDILMWSHYGAGHTGVCVEFRAENDIAFIGAAQRVVYADTYTELPLLRDGHCQAERVVLTKSSHWKYEREWRVVLVSSEEFGPRPGDKYYQLPAHALTGIIFG
jgi:hypothetical protein